MKITFYGHACLLIEVSGKKILVDPFISANPKAAHININELRFDYILLTHAHQDHTLDVEHLMQFNPDATIVSNAEIITYYMQKGLKGRYVKVLAKNRGVCPSWHPGAGGKAWIFADEISIE